MSQHNISRVSFLGVVACLPQVSFFLFPLATISLLILIFFRMRRSKRPGARDRSGILKVGLHHDVPAVLDHGQGEQDHAPPHHAAQEVRLRLQILEVLCLQECISVAILRETDGTFLVDALSIASFMSLGERSPRIIVFRSHLVKLRVETTPNN